MRKAYLGAIFGALILISLLALPAVQAGHEGDYAGEILISVTVLDGDEPIEDAEVDLYDGDGNLVDAATTDEDGVAFLASNESIDDGEIRVDSEDMDERRLEDLEYSLPDGDNVRLYSETVRYDITDRAESFYQEHKWLLISGVIFILIVILAVISAESGTRPW